MSKESPKMEILLLFDQMYNQDLQMENEFCESLF